MDRKTKKDGRTMMDATTLLERLAGIVGKKRVLRGGAMERHRTGFRIGGGPALAVVLPATLVELWHVVRLCVAARHIVIMQAANTSLTGGATPDGDGYDRGVVIINAMAIKGVHLVDGGRQVLCLPGATLHELEAVLAPLGREPHSLIGSSCIGASVIGGVCNNSGGSLIRRGPAYTEMALFAQVGADGELRLVNHLGVRLSDDPVEALEQIQRGGFDVTESPARASDSDYQRRVRDVDASTPARYNADPRCLHEASGSAGRLILFAVRLDSFPKPENSRVYYLGTNDPAELGAFRRAALRTLTHLPIAAEYMHRDAFDIAATYGKDSFFTINLLGTAALPRFFAWKETVERLGRRLRLGEGWSDRALQRISRLLPSHLPRRMRDFRDRFEHHLLVKVDGEGMAEMERLLAAHLPSAAGDYFTCTVQEGAKAFLHRFVAAGAAVRYRAVHRATVEDIVALDVALRRNEETWFDSLPGALSSSVIHRLFYGHFFCHVFHLDYIVPQGVDTHALKQALIESLDARGAEYPAEHNVGHVYAAKPALSDFYRALDPTNSLNPGIGLTSKRSNWA